MKRPRVVEEVGTGRRKFITTLGKRIMNKDAAQYTLQMKAKMFKALGHPTRLEIVEKLAEGEQCVCELQKLSLSDISTVSKHLSVLLEAGIVEREKRGTMVMYRLTCPCVIGFSRCLQSTIEAQKKQWAELLES